LKSVFAKTGVRRQAELVRLVLLSDPAFAGRG
jgi:DNA-binding CsgD family transcriptional regulator